MWQAIKNIYYLGVKEIRGLLRDIFMVALILYTFTLQVNTIATSSTDSINDAAVAVVDEDHSQLSRRLIDSLLPPHFLPPKDIENSQIDQMLDNGTYTFVIVIPENFQRDVMAGSAPSIQLNVDATRMSQAFTGASYIQQIFSEEVANYFQRGETMLVAADIVPRNRFNANLTESWFQTFMQLVNDVSLLAIILTGAALIRERERGTLEHLLVMPVTPFQIMSSKIWSMGIVVWIATALSVKFVINGYLDIPIYGSYWLFMGGVALHLFAMTSMGIFLACVADSMPQLGMLMILVLMPMQMLSGGATPRESMPEFVQMVMLLAPTTHFVKISQAVLFRGANLSMVWQPFAWLFGIGAVLFGYSLFRFRKSLAS